MSNQPLQIIEPRRRGFSGAEADGVRQAGVVGTGSDRDVDTAAIVGLWKFRLVSQDNPGVLTAQ
jgi:hypothetical protein